MGTNYTVYISNEDVNHDCKALHIGKSSSGWVFGLRVYPEQGIHSLYDWIPIIVNSENVIRDEYGRHITAAEMLKTITCRSREQPTDRSERDLAMNSAELGPNNLLRGQVSSELGRTHGEGTWDYCNYEFS